MTQAPRHFTHYSTGSVTTQGFAIALKPSLAGEGLREKYYCYLIR